jgi:hypothetical protein
MTWSIIRAHKMVDIVISKPDHEPLYILKHILVSKSNLFKLLCIDISTITLAFKQIFDLAHIHEHTSHTHMQNQQFKMSVS